MHPTSTQSFAPRMRLRMAFTEGLGRCIDLFGVWDPPSASEVPATVAAYMSAYGDRAGVELQRRNQMLSWGLLAAFGFYLLTMGLGCAVIIGAPDVIGEVPAAVLGAGLVLAGPGSGVAVVVRDGRRRAARRVS